MMKKISEKIDLFNEKIGTISSYLIIPMILITFLVAFMRYALDFGSIAIQETIIYLHAFIFIIGSGFTLKDNMHVRIDIFYDRFSLNKKKIIDLYGTLLFLIPTCLVIFFTSFNYVMASVFLLESSKEAGGLQILYVLKIYILILPTILALQGISELIKNSKGKY
jgi:TRAP-type mannitol/chloroaromatic compound transport system permease small subunit